MCESWIDRLRVVLLVLPFELFSPCPRILLQIGHDRTRHIQYLKLIWIGLWILNNKSTAHNMRELLHSSLKHKPSDNRNVIPPWYHWLRVHGPSSLWRTSWARSFLPWRRRVWIHRNSLQKVQIYIPSSWQWKEPPLPFRVQELI